MGSCLSKKTTICSTPSALPDPPDQTKTNTNPQLAAEKKKPEEETLKKEIFVIKHRKSHDMDRRSDEEKPNSDQKIQCTATTSSTDTASESADLNNTSTSNGGFPNGGIVVRTSSCTKEEVDAILIQCGRLSRSSSTGKAPMSGPGGGSCGGRERKYSGSKRSYDFDHETLNTNKDKKKGNGVEDGNYDDDFIDGGDDETAAERIHRHRQRHRQSRSSSASATRRRTPSRERDQQQQQQRSGSRERGGSGGGGGRRVSRSPGRRSESPITGGVTTLSANAGGSNACYGSGRPGKMISVPATDKSNNVGGVEAAAIKRISVKRNAGGEAAAAMGCRSAASPRSRSPARANVRAGNENQNGHSNQPLSLSRSNSRKAEHSPYRRNPLAEIDQNCIGFEVPLPTNKAANNVLSQAPMQKQNNENMKSNKVTVQGTDNKTNYGKGTLDNKFGTSSCRAKEQQQVEDEGKGLQPMTGNVAVTVVSSGPEILKPPTITRSRSSRLSRDLDLNPDALLNPSPSSYTALLLEDIQNFHQKGAPAISLPPCVTKACSILEAVADLNSSTSSNLMTSTEQFSKEGNFSFGSNPVGKKRLESKDPFVESEVLVSDDLTEPSFHKYVTVRRGTVGGSGGSGGGDVEEQESSGSNSFVAGGQQHWVSSSSWEPNSADSTDHWTSSRSNNTREDDRSPPGFQRHAFSEPRCDLDEPRRRMGEKKRESDDRQQNGIGRGRVGSSRGLHSTPPLAAAST